MSGIALHGHGGARLGKDSLLGVVGEYDDQRRRHAQRRLVGEAALADGDGVDAAKGTIHAVHPELALVHVTQTSLQPEMAVVAATSCEE